MGSTSLSSFTTFLQKTTSSSSLSKERKNSCSTVLCCHGRRTNASPSTVMKRSSMAATEEQVIIKEELGVSDLMNCNGINGSSSDLLSTESGIGITRFIRGKKLFITGATGFLAKVLIEKILRMTPDVGKIYVLIQAKNKKAAVDRLKNEIINRELFRSLQAIHGKNYQAFMLRKLIPVAGNVREDDMGIEAKLAEEISEEIDVVVNSAANTTFDERYDVALDINTIGPLRLMRFAKTFKRLKVFLQVSTAYVNGKRQGRVLEKPFCTGDTIVKELFSHELSADSTMPLLDIEAEIDLAFRKKSSPDDSQLVQQLKDLGLKRYSEA